MNMVRLSRMAGLGALLLAAAPALAQTAPRPHHANYEGDARQITHTGQTVPPTVRPDTSGGYHRPHHAD
jgi:hypothetical protein